MKLLAISDQRLPKMQIASYLKEQYGDISAVISCGDMDPDYLNFIVTVLSVPLFYVRGNHDTNYTDDTPGGINLHMRTEKFDGLHLAGLEGSIRYNKGEPQYTQFDMYLNVLQMLPSLLLRRLLKGHGTDIMVCHSPPRYIHDLEDRAHQGFKALRWLIRLARPRYLIHGHVDIYDQRTSRETDFFGTRVININPSKLIEIEEGHQD